MKIHPETLLDGYKVDHRRQYPDKTEIIVANLTARKTRRVNVTKVVYILGQYFCKEYLINQWNENFFSQPVERVAARFKRRINNYLGPNQVGDQHIRDLHALGYLPLDIYALPEGTEYPLRVPCVVIFNTDTRFGWLTNYVETILSTTVWGPCTSATTALQYKKLLTAYSLDTVGNTDFVQWQAHDFSFRGMFGLEAACMSGAAHLMCFTGTDTVPAIDFLEEYYNADSDKELVGGSVAATEHSVACSIILDFANKVRIENAGTDFETKTEDELMKLADVEYVRHLIMDVYPTGIVSIVYDSFDYWNSIINTTRALKDVILARNGKVVFRPDTGDPVKIVCGYRVIELERDWDDIEIQEAVLLGAEAIKISYDKEDCYYGIIKQENEYKLGKPLTEPEIKGSIECLWEIFGGTTTEKGYKLLDSHVGLIYGDSITLERCNQICEGLKQKGFASTNIVFGIGSYTYQHVTRDTDGYAVKATWAQIKGEARPIYKKPKTDDGTKNSAKGLTAVFKDENGEFYLKDEATWDEVRNCELKHVFSNGKLLIDQSLSEIRARLTV